MEQRGEEEVEDDNFDFAAKKADQSWSTTSNKGESAANGKMTRAVGTGTANSRTVRLPGKSI